MIQMKLKTELKNREVTSNVTQNWIFFLAAFVENDFERAQRAKAKECLIITSFETVSSQNSSITLIDSENFKYLLH